MLNRTVFRLTALATVIATPVLAADMPVKAMRGAPPVATTWTGCYLNAGAGYGFFSQEQHAVDNGIAAQDETTGGNGWLGKVGGGCDYQFSPGSGWGNWVVGAFADYDFMDLRGHLGVGGTNFRGTEKGELGRGGGRTDRILGHAANPHLR